MTPLRLNQPVVDTNAASIYLFMCGVTRLGRMEDTDTGKLCPQKRTPETPCIVAKFLDESMRQFSPTNPLIGSERKIIDCQHLESGSVREDLKLDATPHHFWETENIGCSSLTLCLGREDVLRPPCPAEFAIPVSTNMLVSVSR